MFKFLIVLLLCLGFVYRLFLTQEGYFIFNIDNARDFVDVREMVELKKPRLIGQTSAIEGFYNGPFWYYLIAIPFIISKGDPYSAIILQNILWFIGGVYLYLLVKRWGKWISLFGISIWVSGSYLLLASSYSFNPNPVLFLAPVFIYFLEKYLITEKFKYAVLVFVLSGLFFNFEMNAGVFLPIIILLSIVFSKKTYLLKTKSFWIGVALFGLFLIPQVLFDIKYKFIMTKSLMKYLSGDKMETSFVKNIVQTISTFWMVFSATFLNLKLLTGFFVFTSLIYGCYLLIRKNIKLEIISLISLLLIIVPLVGYFLIPAKLNSWHLGLSIVGIIIIVCSTLNSIFVFNKLVVRILVFIVLILSVLNLSTYYDETHPNNDPSLYKNEINAIDYVYKNANGQDFKVYIYLPSVIDYPYQYLFWWYGKNKYGYLPVDYAYLPEVPEYIKNKDKFSGWKKDTELIYLIKEPDRNGIRHLWENNFTKNTKIEKTKIGNLEIEKLN